MPNDNAKTKKKRSKKKDWKWNWDLSGWKDREHRGMHGYIMKRLYQDEDALFSKENEKELLKKKKKAKKMAHDGKVTRSIDGRATKGLTRGSRRT